MENKNIAKSIQLFHGNIYTYVNDKNKSEIAMYLCDTNLGNKVCMIPLDNPDGYSNTVTIEGMKKVLYPENYFEIEKSKIVSILKLKGKNAIVDYQTYLQISEIVIHSLLAKTTNTYQSLSHKRFQNIGKENFILTEDYYKYLTWFDFKTKLQFQRELRAMPGILLHSVYWAELGRNVGSELEKLRPVLIFKKLLSKKYINDSSVIVLPISSKFTCQRYNTNYPLIINGKINYVKINDIQRISIKRLSQPYRDSEGKVVVIGDEDIKHIKEIIVNYFVNDCI
nr:MAG TPA: PemK-like protein [Caudoviricetes sp.]